MVADNSRENSRQNSQKNRENRSLNGRNRGRIMMLELLGSIIISQSQPTGLPYYPSAEKPAGQQGYTNCDCGKHPDEKLTEIVYTYNVNLSSWWLINGTWELYEEGGWTIGLKSYKYGGTLGGIGYTAISGNHGESAPYGCYEIAMKYTVIGAAGYYKANSVSHQPACQVYKPPCPRVRIQGMPGQTIRVRCKGKNECNDTNPAKPK